MWISDAHQLEGQFSERKASLVPEKMVKGCSRCGKSNRQVCSYISEGSSFSCSVSGKQYSTSSSFSCDSSEVAYLLGCKVCGKQYVGSTFTPLRTRFNNYKSSSKMFPNSMSVAQAELFRQFTEANQNIFLDDVTIQTIVGVSGESRLRKRFWQLKLNSFMPEGLNVRFVDH